jgi:hypothetical protein
VWVKPLVYTMLALLDLLVIALLGTQLAAHEAVSWSLLLPTIFFNFFGTYLLKYASKDD